jgi:hypothetical protein
MALTKFPGKPKRVVVSLTSGTSWTVPSNCFFVNVTAIAGGGGSGAASSTGATAGGVGGNTTFNGIDLASGGLGGSTANTTLSGGSTSSSSTATTGTNTRGTGSVSGYVYVTSLSGSAVNGFLFARPGSGKDGEVVQFEVSTTPGSSITYAIGAGGTAGAVGSGLTVAGAAGGSGRIDLEYFV